MSTGEHKQLISGLVDEVWNQHNAGRSTATSALASGRRSPSTTSSCSAGSPDLQVTIEEDLIAEGDMVVARLMLTGALLH